MPLKVIGAGFGRTGTMSLQSALDILLQPGKCYHFGSIVEKQHIHLWKPALETGESPDFDHIFESDGFVATMDHPSSEFWEQLMNKYPDAKVILSQHPGGPEKWYDSKIGWASVIEALHVWPLKPVAPIVFKALAAVIFKQAQMPYSLHELLSFSQLVEFQVWGPRTFYDRPHALERYQQRIKDVKAKVPKDRLLVFDVKMGWEPLCQFLDLPVPGEAFPKEDSHSTKNIKQVIGWVETGLWMLYGSSIMIGVMLTRRAVRCSKRKQH